MPFTTKAVRAVDPVATQYVQAITQNPEAFVMDRVSPEIETMGEATGTYYIIGNETFMGSGSTFPAGDYGARAIGAPFERLPVASATSGTFRVIEYGFEDVVDDTGERHNGMPVALEEVAQRRTALETLRARELRGTAVLQSTTSITQNTTLSGISQWDDPDDSTPTDDILTAIQTVVDAVAYDPAEMVIFAVTNRLVMRYLKFHADLLNKLQDDKTRMIDESRMLELFGLEELIVAPSYRNTSKLGQTASLASIWSDDFLVGIKPRSIGVLTIVGHATFRLREQDAEMYREEPRTSVWLTSHEVDEVLTNANSFFLIKDCIGATA